MAVCLTHKALSYRPIKVHPASVTRLLAMPIELRRSHWETIPLQWERIRSSLKGKSDKLQAYDE